MFKTSHVKAFLEDLIKEHTEELARLKLQHVELSLDQQKWQKTWKAKLFSIYTFEGTYRVMELDDLTRQANWVKRELAKYEIAKLSIAYQEQIGQSPDILTDADLIIKNIPVDKFYEFAKKQKWV